MKPEQSRKLKIGQRLAWRDSATEQCVVESSDWSGVNVKWDNGKEQFFHHNNADDFEVAK
jgi:hypothetical protein